MTPQDLWNDYKKINPTIGEEIDAWAFGDDADLLAQLVLEGKKTATASAYDLYDEDEELSKIGDLSIILDGQGSAVCVIETKSISVQVFKDVSAEHAFKEGEGDRSLVYWRQVHRNFFQPYFEEYGLTFTEDALIVLEEFEVVYPRKD